MSTTKICCEDEFDALQVWEGETGGEFGAVGDSCREALIYSISECSGGVVTSGPSP